MFLKASEKNATSTVGLTCWLAHFVKIFDSGAAEIQTITEESSYTNMKRSTWSVVK